MLVEMKVSGVMLDPLTNMPIIVLKNNEKNKILPIWVGIFEANAIALKREDITTPRPMTHDLISNIIDGINAQVDQIVVTSLKDNTFYAEIHIRLNGAEHIIDSRPSDAIALALRVSAPIFVEDEVIEKANQLETVKGSEESEAKIKKWFDGIDPDEFGKYEM
ncbi:bifunctional nuclease family protein [Acidobacteriota bacterium]